MRWSFSSKSELVLICRVASLNAVPNETEGTNAAGQTTGPPGGEHNLISMILNDR